MTLVKERLPGCNAESLDSYLRGLGFFVLAGKVDPSVRAWWDEDDALWIASAHALEELAARVLDELKRNPPLLRTPWRGSAARGRSFVAVRNDARDAELDWLDACALARPMEASGATPARERSDRGNNPLLGQGGAFGNAKPEDAYREALEVLRGRTVSAEDMVSSLVAMLRGEPVPPRLARRSSTTRGVLGAYQSGRGTGAGASSRDVEPTSQTARSSVWDVVLVLTGLRLFRGAPTRRPDPRARIQASFPLLVRSRAITTRSERVVELRHDDPQAYELLAPLWSTPCTARVLRQLVASTRLRLPLRQSSRLGRLAQDTLDGVLVQASRAVHGLGFDRLVRFAFIAGADPRYRYAVRRGEVHARGLRAARLAVEEILPFLRELDRAGNEAPASFAVARRRLDDALAAFGQPGSSLRGRSDARRCQEALSALASLQPPAARLVVAIEPPRLSSEWFRLADDGSVIYRLARALVAGLSDGEACMLRETMLPQRRNDHGQFVLDAARTPPDLEHVADPLTTLVELALAALRRTSPERLSQEGSASFSDLAWLLSGVASREEERRLTLLCAALAGVHPTVPRPVQADDPAGAGIGADIARLLLAAQPATDEPARSALERTATLAALLLAGRIEVARTMADRELRRRGLDLLPAPPHLARAPRPAALALAVLLPFDREACAALARAVSISSVAPPEQGGAP